MRSGHPARAYFLHIKTNEMTKLKKLYNEYKALQAAIFGGAVFAIVDTDSEQHARYQQLLGLFKPQYRTRDWVNPMDED